MSGSSRKGRPPLSQNQAKTRSATSATIDSPHRGLFGASQKQSHTAHDDGESNDNWKRAIEAFQMTFQKAFKDLQESLQKLESELGKAIEFQSKRIDDLFDKMATNDTQLKDMQQKLSDLENKITTKDSDVNKLERMTRRNNFRIVGVPSTTGEDCEEFVRTKVFPLFQDSPDMSIERCHRDGRGTSDHPPHILIRCLSYKSKLHVMKYRRAALQDQRFFIVDDLTRVDLLEKKKWATKVKELYDSGTKLRFTGGKWRDSTGKPYNFQN